MTQKQIYTKADLQINNSAKFIQTNNGISHTHIVVFSRPLSTAERHLFVDVLKGFYYTAYFSKQFEVEFLAEPLVEFDSSEQARYTLRQKDLSGSAWKNLLLAIFSRFSEEIVPIIKLDGQYLFDPAHLKVAAD